MCRNLFVRCCLVLLVLQSIAPCVRAYQHELRVPLVGSREYYNASGSARLFEIRRVTRERDREELVIEVNNVPLTPGTVLVVYIGDEQVGKITLNSKRSGSLKLTSDFRKS